MLVHWQSHQEYLHFLHETKVHLDSSQRTRLHLEFDDAHEKLRVLNLDPVMEYLSAFYSHTGRPAVNQPQLLHSLILIMLLGLTSLTLWCRRLRADSLLAVLIGCRPNSLPPLGSYFDLMDRLWTQPESLQKTGRKDLFPKDKNSRPSKKPGKGKKLPNKHPGITEKLAAYALSHESFPFHYEERLQQLFRLAALIPSLMEGLSPGTALPSLATAPVSIPMLPLMGMRSVPPADPALRTAPVSAISLTLTPTGRWDSDEEIFYFGHTLYMLCSHNADTGIDLPLHIHFLDAKRHDSVSEIVSLREFKMLNPDIPVRNVCLDSAHDNYATYDLLKEWNTRPFIDLNMNRGRPDSIPDSISIDGDGTPLCMAGLRMVNWGYCRQKNSRK